MSSPGGETPDLPDFSDFELPTDGLLPAEEAAATDASGEALSPALEPLAMDEVAAQDAAPSMPELPGEAAPLALAAGAPALAALGTEGETVPAEQAKEKPAKRKKAPKSGDGLLKKLSKWDPYVVILGLSFIALLIAVLCLVMELSQFHYDVKAKEAKKQAAVTAPYQLAPARTTAAA